MTTWFITRHPGARSWAVQQNLVIDRYCTHLDPADIQAGDTIIGSLPVHLAAAVCSAGANYINLSIDLPAHARGKELTCEQLIQFNARLEAFHTERIAAPIHPEGLNR
jgi:CRISPR-associated protein Csx16